MDELSDIVNQQDQVIATKMRSQLAGDFVNTRYVNLFIRNSRGQLWVPFRNDDVKRWPSSPDFTVGGAVLAGEDYETAVIREAREEIGLELDIKDIKLLAYLSPYKFPIACFAKNYEYVCDDAPTVVPDEHKL